MVFVAIVWTVAGSLVAIEIAALGGLDWFMSSPELAGNLVLSNATRDSKTCTVPAGERAAPAEVRAAAWLMGLKIGRDGNARQSASVDPDTLAQALKDVETLANMLSVPAPQPFVPRQLAEANTEFIRFVESDSNETARSLALEHSPESCHLFKLGALWGYASLVRPFLPGERAMFAAEIRHHAQNAALESSVWQPMIESTRASASGEEIFRADAALTDRLTQYLGGQR
jgi:hypothetical protein